MSLPATPYQQPDTPSREVKLEPEPRGSEFEVRTATKLLLPSCMCYQLQTILHGENTFLAYQLEKNRLERHSTTKTHTKTNTPTETKSRTIGAQPWELGWWVRVFITMHARLPFVILSLSVCLSVYLSLSLSLQYFKNVLFEYMMGRQTKVCDSVENSLFHNPDFSPLLISSSHQLLVPTIHTFSATHFTLFFVSPLQQLVKPITALARFTDSQKRQLFAKEGVA